MNKLTGTGKNLYFLVCGTQAADPTEIEHRVEEKLRSLFKAFGADTDIIVREEEWGTRIISVCYQKEMNIPYNLSYALRDMLDVMQENDVRMSGRRLGRYLDSKDGVDAWMNECHNFKLGELEEAISNEQFILGYRTNLINIGMIKDAGEYIVDLPEQDKAKARNLAGVKPASANLLKRIEAQRATHKRENKR